MWLKVIELLLCVGIFAAGFMAGHYSGYATAADEQREQNKAA